MTLYRSKRRIGDKAIRGGASGIPPISSQLGQLRKSGIQATMPPWDLRHPRCYLGRENVTGKTAYGTSMF